MYHKRTNEPGERGISVNKDTDTFVVLVKTSSSFRNRSVPHLSQLSIFTEKRELERERERERMRDRERE